MVSVFKDPRKAAYLNPAGADKPLRSPLPFSTLTAARSCRKRLMVEQVVKHDCAAILLFVPVNIRYALDVSNMQLWAAHNPFHYALVFADGHAIDFEYAGAEHLATGLGTVDEIDLPIRSFTCTPVPILKSGPSNGRARSSRPCAIGVAAICGLRPTSWNLPAQMRCARKG